MLDKFVEEYKEELSKVEESKKEIDNSIKL